MFMGKAVLAFLHVPHLLVQPPRLYSLPALCYSSEFEHTQV